MNRTRVSESGSAMLITMILISALLGGAAVLTSMQLQSTQASGLARMGRSSLHCAEAGLAAARPIVARSYPLWNAALGQPEPSWLAGIDHDLDDDGVDDFTITLRDNDDETITSDLTRDNDLMIYIVSTCLEHPEVTTQLAELVRHNGGGGCYQAQFGGCGGNGNAN